MRYLAHPTAIIHPLAMIEDEVYIGPYCLIGQCVMIGSGTRIEGYTSIGTRPEHKKFWDKDSTKYGVTIGKNCVIREFATINSGTFCNTILEDEVTMLRGAHVGHDAYIEKGVTLSCNVLVGGESHIQEGANLGLGAILHQRSVVGAYSMLGMGSIVTKTTKIDPFHVFVGAPAKVLGRNLKNPALVALTEEKKHKLLREYERLLDVPRL